MSKVNVKCFVPNCTNSKKTQPQKQFFYVRKCLQKKWCQQAQVTYYSKYQYYCCEDHLNLEEDLENYYYWKFMKGKPVIKPTANLKLNSNGSLQASENTEEVSELQKLLMDKENMPAYKVKESSFPAASESLWGHDIHKEAQETTQQPQPGPSEPQSTTSDELRTRQDPQSTGKLEQCRFCGEFDTTCVPVSRMLYLSNNKTTVAVNENIVQLDFNDVSLPNTACKECDRQLKEMYEFIQVVIDAQNNLIKIGDLDTEENVEKENTDELETVVVKTECDDDSDENRNEDTENGDDDKDVIKDSLTVGTAVFINETVPQKRKVNTNKETAKKPKKAPDTENKSEIEDSEFIIDIKEEVIERKERNYDVNNIGCSMSDTGTDVKPDKVELATNALIYEMRREGEDGFS